jgi:hypothetical protein
MEWILSVPVLLYLSEFVTMCRVFQAEHCERRAALPSATHAETTSDELHLLLALINSVSHSILVSKERVI